MPSKYSMPALERPSAGVHGSGMSTRVGYKIEVRSTYSQPTVIGDFVIDTVWRALPIGEGHSPWGHNVPVGCLDRELLQHGLVPRAAAEAHRWAFLALLEAKDFGGTLCIETRLVKVELKVQYSTEEKGVSDPMSASFSSDMKVRDRAAFVNEVVPNKEVVGEAEE